MNRWWRHIGWSAILIIGLNACGFQSSEAPEPPNSGLDFPQDVLFVDDLLVVASTGYDASDWRMGRIDVYRMPSLEHVGQHTVSKFNPQHLYEDGDDILIVNTGTYDFSDFNDPKAATPGSVDRIEKSDLIGIGQAKLLYSFDQENFPAPIDLIRLNETQLGITSGLKPIFGVLDETLTIQAMASLNSTALGRFAQWNELTFIVDFNSDTAHVYDSENRALCEIELGEFPDEMEGATTPVIFEDALYYILALSGTVRRISLSESAPCSGTAKTIIAPLGQVPNDLHVRSDGIFVVHSADNNLIQYDPLSGDEIERYPMPLGSNPWAAAFSHDGRYIAVTEWARHQITLIDRSTGQLSRL